MRKFIITQIFLYTIAFAIVPPKNIKPTANQLKLMDEIRKTYGEGFWAEKFSARFEMASKFGKKYIESLAPDTVYAPVLFGKYADRTEIHSTSAFQQLLFDGPNSSGTVTDFYKENSYGKLIMTGECKGWYKLPRIQDYYVKDGDRNQGLSYGGKDFTIDLMVEADKFVDYGKYVSKVDAEGAHVSILAVYHSGADAAAGADNIWSHRSSIRARLLQRRSMTSDTLINKSRILTNGHYVTNDTLNGRPVIIDGDYCIQPELRGSNNTQGQMKPIGVLAHELGHIFGLPDLYDTDNSSAGIGNWCVMSGGSYGGDGSHEGTPAQFSAWCKEKLGWVAPTIVTSYMPKQAIKFVEQYPEIYKIYPNNISGVEYFLIENRQKVKFDTYLLNSGILIWHIDNSRTSNSNESRRLVDIEQADGLRQLNTGTARGDAGDPYPGSSVNRIFDGYSNPNSTNYALQQTYAGVRNITNSDTVMFADLDVGTRAYISNLTTELIESDSSNKNGRVDPGEKGNLRIKAENIYPVNLQNGKILVTSALSDFVIDTTTLTISVVGLSSLDTTFKNIVAIKPNSATGRKTINVNITSPEETFKFKPLVMVGYPKLVLINADSVAIEKVDERYERIVQSAGKETETVNLTSDLRTLALKERKTIIFFSGRKKANIISQELGDSLLSFINKGGNVFLTGQNIAEDFSQRKSNLSERLIKSSFKQNIIFGKTLYGIPTNGMGAMLSQFTLGGIGATSNQISPDDLYISNAAMPIFKWTDSTSESFGGVWWKNSSGGKLLFWAFGMEGIPDSVTDGTVTSAKAITTVINWFEGTLSTPDISKNNLIPEKLTLMNNYPNPFNPETAIKFGIPHRGLVKIKIYDLLGRNIATLVNEELPAGYQIVNFNAATLASGSYIYQIENNNKIITKKMLLLK